MTGRGAGGHAAGDRLYGIENLVGSAFADTLFGDDGANRLAGRGGNDVLLGRGGADAFVFGPGSGTDTVLDFQTGIDRIDLSALHVGWEGVNIGASAGGAIVSAGGSTILLQGVMAGALTQGDFIL
jgi:Ca2+-binding RTX toxin-like protein